LCSHISCPHSKAPKAQHTAFDATSASRRVGPSEISYSCSSDRASTVGACTTMSDRQTHWQSQHRDSKTLCTKASGPTRAQKMMRFSLHLIPPQQSYKTNCAALEPQKLAPEEPAPRPSSKLFQQAVSGRAGAGDITQPHPPPRGRPPAPASYSTKTKQRAPRPCTPGRQSGHLQETAHAEHLATGASRSWQGHSDPNQMQIQRLLQENYTLNTLYFGTSRFKKQYCFSCNIVGGLEAADCVRH
jgi:hypothetical protein